MSNGYQVARGAIGVLSTENRKIWSQLRTKLAEQGNRAPLQMIDQALFIVCLDDTIPDDLGNLCGNFLCGTYELDGGVQIGTCTNRWYDKVWPFLMSDSKADDYQLQIIVCADGSAGINFEHTGVDGHTVLRYVTFFQM